MGVLERNLITRAFSGIRVSIPGRDLGVLERPAVIAGSRRSPMFQSLEGIWGFWNVRFPAHHRTVSRFNPWKGFGGFGTAVLPDPPSVVDSFQSLEGIWGFWNAVSSRPCMKCRRFNPWKGFGGFGTTNGSALDVVEIVSIPGRDLGVLERGN